MRMHRAARLLIVFAIVASFAGLSSSPAGSADICYGETDWDRSGGHVKASLCYPEGGSGWSPGTHITTEDEWFRFGCGDYPYEYGVSVLIVQRGRVLTIEEMGYNNLNPTAVWRTWILTCNYGDGQSAPAFFGDSTEAAFWSTVWEDPATPPINPRLLRDDAARAVPIPEPDPASAPDFEGGDTTVTVQVPTWFWIEHAWEPTPIVTRTRGLATVAVQAYPVEAVWVLGDGSTITCTDGGTPWVAGMAEDASDCSHVFENSSADESAAAFSAEVTVTWDYQWWINGQFIEVFGPSEPQFAFEIPVGEIQALAGSSE